MTQGQKRRTRLLATLCLTAVLATLLTLASARAVERGKTGRCEHLIDNLMQAIKAYEIDWNTFPPSGIENVAKALRVPVETLVDPWGRRLVYRNNTEFPPRDDGSRPRGSFDLYSVGLNGVDNDGGGDDIPKFEGWGAGGLVH